MDRFGLTDRGDEPVAAYSFGMRRRLALAEVFAGSPDLLLLDEPTLGLDPAGRLTLIEVLREAAAGGAGAAVCSNDPSFVEAVADRVVLLDAGVEIAAGAPARLIAELAAATILEVTLRAARPEASGASRVAPAAEGEEGWPEGICRLAGSGRILRFSSCAGGAALPELCAELRARRLDVEDIRLHEPGLADVFASLSGTPLLPPDSDGGASP